MHDTLTLLSLNSPSSICPVFITAWLLGDNTQEETDAPKLFDICSLCAQTGERGGANGLAEEPRVPLVPGRFEIARGQRTERMRLAIGKCGRRSKNSSSLLHLPAGTVSPQVRAIIKLHG